MSQFKYTPEMEERIRSEAANGVTPEVVAKLTAEFGYSERSVAAKVRSLGFEVPKKSEGPKFTAEETKAFSDFLEANTGKFTSAEIAGQFMNGKFEARQVMGKALALEMTSHIKKTEKVAKPKDYTPEEESLVTKLVEEGKFLEEIAEAVGKPVNSIRGKLLSMKLKAPQRDKKVQATGGSYPGLEEIAGNMTVEELKAHYEKDGTERSLRGIKTALTRRKVEAKDYPAKKAA